MRSGTQLNSPINHGNCDNPQIFETPEDFSLVSNHIIQLSGDRQFICISQ